MRKKILLPLISGLLLTLVLSACGYITGKNNTAQTQAPSQSPDAVSDSNSPSPSAIVPTDDDNSTTPEPSPEVSASPVAEGTLAVVIEGSTVDAAAVIEKYSFRDIPPLSFEIYIEKEKYKRSDSSGSSKAYRYTYTGDESGNTFIEISFYTGTSAKELAPSFMNDYIDFTSIEFSSYTKIGRDGLDSHQITADSGSLHTEAYLIDSGDAVVAVVLSCGIDYESEALPYLTSMLGSFSLQS